MVLRCRKTNVLHTINSILINKLLETVVLELEKTLYLKFQFIAKQLP